MILNIANAAIGYQREPLHEGLNFELDRTQVGIVRGPNGSGKSTLLRCVCGLMRPLEGVITVKDLAVDDRNLGFRRTVASLLDGGAWYPALTVGEHLELIERVNVPRREDWFTASDLLARFGLTHRVDVVPGRLSSGEQQRLSLAMVLLRPSDLLVLDEPERHLDQDGREALIEGLNDYTRFGSAALVVTHDDRIGGPPDARRLLLALPGISGGEGA